MVSIGLYAVAVVYVGVAFVDLEGGMIDAQLVKFLAQVAIDTTLTYLAINLCVYLEWRRHRQFCDCEKCKGWREKLRAKAQKIPEEVSRP